MALISQNAYAKKHKISPPRVSAMKANGQLVMRPHPTQKNKDGTSVMMVDELASDLLNGRAKLTSVDINAKPEPYKPESDPLDESDIQASRARKEYYLAQNEKLEYEIKKGGYILKSDMVKEAFELGREIREKMRAVPKNGLALKLSRINDPHEIEQLLLSAIDKALTNVDI